MSAATSQAQTWIGTRTTPALTEIVAIDATGEDNWLYGQEDLAGDGLASFKQQEQSIDVRTGYAATDATRFWVRVYVSDPNAVGGNISVFVFLDSDANNQTGGTAAAPAIDPKLTMDPSTGGYEYVIGIRGNGSIADVWEWQTDQWVSTMPGAAQAAAETGQDGDPIQINGIDHGYLQAMVDLDVVGLTQACNAFLFLRSVNNSAGGDGDLEVGKVAPCVPADENGDDVPDLVVPVDVCTEDGQCPGGGICVDGVCVLAIPCATDADCDPKDFCSDNGNCIPRPTGDCSSNADCGDLVCIGGTCSACTVGADQCDSGLRCAPTGRCVVDEGTGDTGGIPLNPGDQVQGGAFACSASPGESGSAAALVALGAGLAIARRRRKRPEHERQQP